MLAQNNDFIASASQSLYESNADEVTREKCRTRENYMCLERKLAEQEAALSLKKTNSLGTSKNSLPKLALQINTEKYKSAAKYN